MNQFEVHLSILSRVVIPKYGRISVDKKAKMANVMFEILDGLSLV